MEDINVSPMTLGVSVDGVSNTLLQIGGAHRERIMGGSNVSPSHLYLFSSLRG